MRVSTKRILSILTGFVFLLGAFFVYFGPIRGEIDAVGQTRGVLASKEALLGNQQAAVNQVKELLGEFNNFKQLQTTVARAIPNGPDAIQALRQIEAVGKSAGAAIVGLDFETPREVTKKGSAASVVKYLRTLQVKVQAEGTYENLKKFLKLLETSVRVANVTRFTYNPGATASATGSLSLDLEMYYQQ